MITQLYASLATGFFLLLTVRIFGIRGNPLFKFISYGNENEEVIHRAVRGHGNFIDYAPLFFILLYLKILFLKIISHFFSINFYSMSGVMSALKPTNYIN